MILVKFHVILAAVLKIAFCDVKYLTNKNDKDLEDERHMMENHRCYSEGEGAGRVTHYL